MHFWKPISSTPNPVSAPNRKLDALIEKYKNASTQEDRLVKARLNYIAELCNNCDVQEARFANEIIDAFCDLIEKMEDYYQEELYFVESAKDSAPAEQPRLSFVAYNTDVKAYQHETELIDDFFAYLSQTPKRSNKSVSKMSTLSINDYIARIRTFAKSYLPRMLGTQDKYDLLFVYDNIADILANFSVENEEGKPSKQLQNIRSALRKLNDFKCKQHSYR